MAVDTAIAIRTLPEPAVHSFLDSMKKMFTYLRQWGGGGGGGRREVERKGKGGREPANTVIIIT